MIKILLHAKILDDIKEHCKNQYKSLDIEMPRVCRLLIEDGRMPGESLVRNIKSLSLQNKTFHARLNLPNENIGKRQGPRIIYVKIDDLIKIIYVGSHKNRPYNDSCSLISLIEERYSDEKYIIYSEEINFK